MAREKRRVKGQTRPQSQGQNQAQSRLDRPGQALSTEKGQEEKDNAYPEKGEEKAQDVLRIQIEKVHVLRQSKFWTNSREEKAVLGGEKTR
jgi:hypothetical protein